MKEMKRDEKKYDKIKALNLVPQKALHVVLQRYTAISTLLITKLWLSLSAKQCRNPRSGPPPVCQDLSTCHDCPVENTINLPIKTRGNSKCASGNLLSPLGAQSKDNNWG